jgi:hypothetical protein
MSIYENRQRNLRLPISFIPNEVISTIFCDLRNSCIGAEAQGEYRHGVECLNGWIGITHVCHAWREIALSSSSLWCHIDVVPLLHNWIPELLRRSRQSPLTVVIIDLEADEHDLLVELKEHLGRVRHLVLDEPHNDSLDQFLTSQTNFQNLETLEISMPESVPPFVLGDSHLHADRLKRLDLQFSCSVDWNSKWFQSLTHLSLVDTHEDVRLGCHDFTHILSQIPGLETLELVYFLRKEEQVQTHQAAKVHLQYLRHLFVECEVPEMARFLPCLVVPRSCKLHLTAGNQPLDDEYRTILSWVSNQFRVPTAPLPISEASDDAQYIRSFYLICCPDVHLADFRFKVMGFCDVLSHKQLETADPILEFSVARSFQGLDCDLPTFLSLLPLGGVTFLGVSDWDQYRHLSPESWTVSFGSIQTLTTVFLYGRTFGLWEALTPADTANRTAKSLPFSALASVTVKDRDLDSQLMLDALRVRFERSGKQLQELSFSRLGRVPPAAVMIQLGELVLHIRVGWEI